MKRLLFVSLFSWSYLGLFAQSSESIKEKYPDDMYTEINGKEVRVNTLPKRIIDSLEALPPQQKMFAIYKVEKATKGERIVQATTPSETYKIIEVDYWTDKEKEVERVYKVYRNSDETTKIEDNDGNWMVINTEYPINEYTGEKSSKPVSAKEYCGFRNSRSTELISSFRMLPNGYKIDVNGFSKQVKITFIPLGIKYYFSDIDVTSDFWYDCKDYKSFWQTFNYLCKNTKTEVKIQGPKGNQLINCTDLVCKDVTGRRINGGYYDKNSNVMYYLHNDDNSTYDKLLFCSPNGYIMKVYAPESDMEDAIKALIRQKRSDKHKADSIARQMEQEAIIRSENIEKNNEKANAEISKLEKEKMQLEKEYNGKDGKIAKEKSPDMRRKLIMERDRRNKEISLNIGNWRRKILRVPQRKPNVSNNIDAVHNSQYIADNVILIPCIASDIISNVITNDKISEIHYQNGDYVKISKLKNGEVFDCKVHRPNGIWTVSQDDNFKPISKFTYTSGYYKGLVYEGKFKLNNYAECLACKDMINRNMMEYTINGYYPTLFDPTKKQYLHVESNGNIKEYVEAEQARRKAAANAQQKQEENAIYQSYCKKYGKSNVDNVFKCSIHSGMPFSVIKDLCYTELTDEIGSTKWYRVLYAGSNYDLKNKKLIPLDVFRVPKAIVSYWLISVSNGTVQSAHVMRVY